MCVESYYLSAFRGKQLRHRTSSIDIDYEISLHPQHLKIAKVN